MYAVIYVIAEFNDILSEVNATLISCFKCHMSLDKKTEVASDENFSCLYFNYMSCNKFWMFLGLEFKWPMPLLVVGSDISRKVFLIYLRVPRERAIHKLYIYYNFIWVMLRHVNSCSDYLCRYLVINKAMMCVCVVSVQHIMAFSSISGRTERNPVTSPTHKVSVRPLFRNYPAFPGAFWPWLRNWGVQLTGLSSRRWFNAWPAS